MNVYAYFDERGCFTVRGYHAIGCAMTLRPFVEFDLEAERVFHALDLDYDLFHATQIGADQRLGVLVGAASLFAARSSVAWVGTFELKRDPAYDTWGPAIINALCDVAQPFVRTHLPEGDQALVFHIAVECRRSFNLLPFEARAEARLKGCLSPPNIQVRTHIIPKGMSAGMQIVDLLANLVGASPADTQATLGPHPWVRRSSMNLTTLQDPHARALVSDMFRQERVQITEVAVETRTRVVTEVVRQEQPPTTRCLRALEDLLHASPEFDGDAENVDWSSVRIELPHNDRGALSQALRGLLDACQERRQQRRPREVAWIALFVLTQIDAEGPALPGGDALRLDAAGLWIDANNHLGQGVARSPRALATRTWATPLLDRADLEPSLTFFFNVLAVSSQNAWDFQTAWAGLEPMRTFFETRRSLAGGIARAEHIGALLGTVATTCFIMAGSGFHTDSSPARTDAFNALTEEGLLYSLLAQEAFVEPRDHERHAIYQAHAHMQRALLFGTSTGLDEAERLLTPSGVNLKSHARSFLTGAFTPPHPNELFRIAAALKLFWLRGDDVLRDANERKVVRMLQDLEHHHPHEQILGYVALGPASKFQRAALNQLTAVAWPSDLITTIAHVFALQEHWQRTHHPPDAEAIEALRALLGEACAEHWEGHGLFDALQGRFLLAWQPRNWRGPLTVLPFNFA